MCLLIKDLSLPNKHKFDCTVLLCIIIYYILLDVIMLLLWNGIMHNRHFWDSGHLKKVYKLPINVFLILLFFTYLHSTGYKEEVFKIPESNINQSHWRFVKILRRGASTTVSLDDGYEIMLHSDRTIFCINYWYQKISLSHNSNFKKSN